jgi:hypothetical protein
MKYVKQFILSTSIILSAFNLCAQNITGTWEGDLGSDQFLQLIIIQNGDKICGYTRDHIKANRNSYCKAYFEGTYDKKKQKLSIAGKFFIENNGSHVLMKLNLLYKKVKGEEILEEKPTLMSVFSSMISIFGTLNDDPFASQPAVTTTEFVHIKKISNEPLEVLDLMKDCLDRKAIDTIIAAPQPKDSLPPDFVIITPAIPKKNTEPTTVVIPEKNRESEISPVPDTPQTDSVFIPKEVKKRKNIEQSHLEINVKTINLKVYDNAIVDGDTVSILYNGRLLFSHQRLTEKALEINLDLDPATTRHEITLFAENLGSIPPNTALVVITAGKKRYELFASASMEENAVLVFDYKPDK